MNTNKILKNLVKNIGKNNKHYFVKELNVDVENCSPIDVTNQKYTKLFKDNLFLFIDSDFRLLGVLNGSTQNISFEDTLYYNYKYYKIVRNRKNLTPISKYILMITPEMQNYSQITRKNKNETKKDIYCRLFEYKKDRVRNITHESIRNSIKDVIDFITKNIFNQQIAINQGYEDMYKMLCVFINEVKLYERSYNMFKNDNSKERDSDLQHKKLIVLAWEKKIKRILID